MEPSVTPEQFVKACPFGNGFHLPAKQAWRTLKVFHAYQIILSVAFFALFNNHIETSSFGQSNPKLFQIASLTYLSITLFSTVFIGKTYLSYAKQVQFKIIADIAFITFIAHASGGIYSGFSILIAVSVAAGGLLAGGQCTLAFAAIATFAVLGEQTFGVLTHSVEKTSYTYAAILSSAFFAIALLALVLTKRAEASEQITQQQSLEIDSLTQLNEYVIKHLQSGIIVIDQHNKVRLTNEAASKLIGTPITIGAPLSDISNEYQLLFTRWIRNPSEDTAIVSASTVSTRTKLRFSRLEQLNDSTYIIFLDDLSAVDQQIQQGKLASLGRLTASIAHEIRNPLGAISHAGELLSESTHIKKEDQRLLNIIHNHTNRVNNIIKSVLQLSRHEKSHIETIHLSKWFHSFDRDFNEEFGLLSSPIQINIDHNADIIQFDSNHLKQIIDNLCGNALKHGQLEGQQPFIHIQTGLRPSSRLVFLSVSDNGNGIDAVTAQKIFEPFFTTSSSGSGLGLYISAQLAELNHAKLIYTTSPTGGSCFTLLFTKIMEKR